MTKSVMLQIKMMIMIIIIKSVMLQDRMMRAKSEVRSRESRARMEVLYPCFNHDYHLPHHGHHHANHHLPHQHPDTFHYHSNDDNLEKQAQERAAMREAIRATSSGPPPSSRLS